jgi:AhpD family alkylhydroperoxidase
MIAETIIEQMAKGIRYIKPVQMDTSGGLASQLYEQMQADFLPVPFLTLHAPLPELMAGAWSILRESLLTSQSGSARARTRKEVVAATVSKTNECPFCVDAHSLMLHASSEHDVASAVLRGDFKAIGDPELQGLAQWALANRTVNHTANHTENHRANTPPFDPSEAPEIVGTAVAFHYINRMVNVFLGETLLPLPSVMKGMTGRLLAPSAGKRFVQPSLPQGKSLAFLPAAKLPADLGWAAANPAVAGAFAGFAALVEQAGSTVLPESVRALVSERVEAWQGEEMGMSRRWVEEIAAKVEDKERSAARLALLTALASYQVDAGIVQAFQTQYPLDSQLIAATAWASFTAARRASSWIAAPLLNLEGIE